MQYDYMKDDNLTPEEKEELLNAEILEIGRLVQEDEASAPQIMNPERYREFQMCEGAIKEVMADTENKVSSKLNEPFASMGSISIEGKDISFEDAEIFNALCRFSSNVEVYILKNGKIRMTFTFLNMTKRLVSDDE